MPIDILEYFEKNLNTLCAKAGALADKKELKEIREKLKETRELVNAGKEQARESIAQNLETIISSGKKYIDAFSDGSSQEEKEILGELVTMEKPLECFMANMNSGKPIKDAFSDSSWIKGFFGKARAFDDRPDYVPGQYKAGSLQKSADDYVNAMKGLKKNYYENLVAITGSAKAPEETFAHQASLFKEITVALGASKTDNPFNDAIKGHQCVWQGVNRERLANLDQDYMPGSLFIDVTLDKYANKTAASGAFDKMQQKSPESKELIDNLQSECFKLYFTGSKKILENGVEKKIKLDLSGATKEQREILDESSILFQTIYKVQSDLEGDPDIVSENNPLNPSYKAIKGITDKILGYIKGDKDAVMPTGKDLSDMADSLINNFKHLTREQIFNNRGFDDNVTMMPRLLETIAAVEPGLKEKSKAFTAMIKGTAEKIHDKELLEIVNNRLKDDRSNLKEIDDKYFGIYTFQRNGFKDQDSFWADKFVKMAADPAYNKYMLEKAKEAILAYTKPTKTLMTKPGGFYTGNGSGHNYERESVYASAYKMYILGSALEEEHNRIDAIKKGERDVKKPRPEVAAMVGKKSCSIKDVNKVLKYYNDFNNYEINAALPKIKPEDFAKVVNGQANLFDVAGINLEASNHLSRMDNRIMSALNQKSGNFYSTNSKQYSDIGDALRRLEDKAQIKAQTKEDYYELFKATSVYMMTHDSKPLSKNGQLRFDSAARLTATIVNKVRNDYPQYKNEINSFININMARSKVFRDEYVSICQKGIKAILGDGDQKISYNALPPQKKEEVRLNAKSVIFAASLEESLGNGKFITGKADSGELYQGILDKCSKAFENTGKLYETFRDNPASFIDRIGKEKDTTKAIEDLKIEQDILTFEPLKL